MVTFRIYLEQEPAGLGTGSGVEEGEGWMAMLLIRGWRTVWKRLRTCVRCVKSGAPHSGTLQFGRLITSKQTSTEDCSGQAQRLWRQRKPRPGLLNSLSHK